MGIRSVQIRSFRSVANSGLDNCGPLNILIGKNNAGKSNVLGAIELVLLHLARGRVSGRWPVNRRPKGEFTDSDELTPLRIGVEFDLPFEVNEVLRSRLTKEAPHLERSIEQIKAHDAFVFILAAGMDDEEGFLFVEQMAVGKLIAKGEDLAIEGGIRLLSVTRPVGLELYRNLMSARLLSADISALEDMTSERRIPWDYILQQPKERRTALFPQYVRARPEVIKQVAPRIVPANSKEEIDNTINQIISEIREKIQAIEKSETEGTLATFAGESKTTPAYAEWLIEQFGSIPFLHIRERKEEIGRDEAQTLLRLKTRRGGPDRLGTIQQTVRALLGVKLDAFEAEDPGHRDSPAEMDVDNFLIDANGAGIREALRIILDLELKSPKIVLIEEPEVHLHPGLSRVLAGYLREKSDCIQMFVTTHSTDFVDSVSFRNVFLVSRGAHNRTECQTVEAEEGALRIPAELGIRLSTVFMFDKLLFVEGPSDESVLREIAKKLQIDFAKSNVGFVYMTGARNFAHFAAESTLELLSRRRIQMWFVTDRDENTDTEINQMIDRLGGRAQLKVLQKREIENYLLNSHAIAAFVAEKLKSAGATASKASAEDVERLLREEAASLRDEVVRLRVEKRLLTPVFLRTRTNPGTIEERIKASIMQLDERLKRIDTEKALISQEVNQSWATRALDYVPGTLLLERIAKRLGISFSKDKGDSERLARHLPTVPDELKELLSEVTREWRVEQP